MSRCEVTLSANAGLVLALGQRRLWVDAVHTAQIPGFSSLSPARLAALWAHPAFAHPDGIFFTHCHPDHYDQELALQALARYPQAALLSPEALVDGQFPLNPAGDRRHLPGLELEFGGLVHEGPQFAAVPHLGCIAEGGDGFRVLLTGDCWVAGADLAEFVAGRRIDLAILDFPWITLRRGREFIAEHIRPRHLLVNHLPFAEDEQFHYRPAAVKSAYLMREAVPDVRLLTEPFQAEAFD